MPFTDMKSHCDHVKSKFFIESKVKQTYRDAMKMMRILFFLILFNVTLHAREVVCNLTVDSGEFSANGVSATSLMINGSIPAPTLYFHVGDVATIHVHNRLKVPTSLHWHGVLLPNLQDGVPFLTTPEVKAGETYTYHFPLKHAGTYWYHSHTGLQEQQGLYGGIVVRDSAPKTDRDYVLVLSDFTREEPGEIMRTLMRGSSYYALRKGTIQSLYGAYQNKSLGDFFEREKSNMPSMDVSDVAYDAFLINGKTQTSFHAKPNEKVKLRIINAGASTYFQIHSALPNLSIVGADGNAVKPMKKNTFLIGMGETYDVVFTMPANGRYELRATSHDQSGYASAWIGTGALHQAPSLPEVNYYDTSLMLDQSLNMHSVHSISPYSQLRAMKRTTISKDHSVRDMELHLTGDMMRYRWSFDNKTLAEDSTILIHRGEVLRIKLVNDSMMNHPMHLHGHFFRMINEAGDYSPLKHTVDLPPMSQRTIEFLANEAGDWIFHCHLLYHMDSGMARVMSYDDQGADHKPNLGSMGHEATYFFVDGLVHSQMTTGTAMLMRGREDIMFDWEHGIGEDEDMEHMDENELLWSHYFNPKISSRVGYRFDSHEFSEGRFFAGAMHYLPYLIAAELTVDDAGDARLSLMKNIQLTTRLAASANVQYDTQEKWMGMFSVEYRLTKQLGLSASWHSDYGAGVGASFHF